MGKSSAPDAPDYVGQAQAQAAGNLQAARSQTTANRVNQITPYGQIKYTQGNGSFDQAGFDAATSKYQSQQAQIQQNAGLQEYYGKTGQLLTAPDRTQFIGGNPDQWSSEIVLDPAQQQLLDAQNQSAMRLAGLQGTAADRVAETMSQPFDTSGIPALQYGVDLSGLSSDEGMQGWQKYSDLLMQRMNPDLDQQQAALDTKLANQGLTAGSEGWNTGQQQFGKQRNDANVAAQLAGAQVQNQFYNQGLGKAGLQFQNADLNNKTVSQALQQQAYLRSVPFQELSALRTGSQVQNPTFSTPGQQGQTAGPDLMGASQSAYNAAVGNTNAQNAQAAGTAQAGAGLASSAIMAFAMY